MDTELIQCLHRLSTRANRIILSRTEVSHIADIDETFDLEQFLDVTCYALQSDLINANEKTINIIVKNLANAVESNCGNNVDLTKYSNEDVFNYSFTTDLNERSVFRRYKITDISPKDMTVFREIWLFHFLENLKTILKNIKVITQQADIIKLDITMIRRISPNKGRFRGRLLHIQTQLFFLYCLLTHTLLTVFIGF